MNRQDTPTAVEVEFAGSCLAVEHDVDFAIIWRRRRQHAHAVGAGLFNSKSQFDDAALFRTLPDEEKRNLLGALIAISTGVKDMSRLNVPAEVGRRLVQCFIHPAKNE